MGISVPDRAGHLIPYRIIHIDFEAIVYPSYFIMI